MMKSDRQALPDMSSSNPPYTPTQTRQTNAKRPPIDPTKLRLEPKITGFRIQFALDILNCRVDSGSPYFFSTSLSFWVAVDLGPPHYQILHMDLGTLVNGC